MLDGAEALLQYGLSPLVAAGAVLWTQRRADQRDESRRRDEQSFELTKRTDDRAFGLQERWRDDRRNAHARVMATTDRLIDLFEQIRMSLLFNTFDDPGSADTRHQFGELVDRDLIAATSEVLLIGSSTAQQRAEALVVAARSAALSVLVLPGDIGVSPDGEHEDVLATQESTLRSARAEYLAAARSDLETD